MTALRTLLGVLLLIVLAGLATASPASAHTQIDPMSPRDGARLTATPDTLEIVFSEPVAASDIDVRATIDGEAARLGRPGGTATPSRRAMRSSSATDRW
jgi:copper transport protein